MAADGGAGRRIADSAVHTHQDVVPRIFDKVRLHAVVSLRRGIEVLVVVGVGLSTIKRGIVVAFRELRTLEENTGVLPLPRVGQAVAIGIDRARVVAAAWYADCSVVYGRTVDRVVYCGQFGRLRLAPAVEDELGLPACLAFAAVGYLIAVGIAAARIGREELVVPVLHLAAIPARVALVDRLAFSVGTAGISAGVFVGEVEPVRVVCRPYLVVQRFVVAGERRRGIDADIEFPAIRHTVAIGIGTVLRDVGRMIDISLLDFGIGIAAGVDRNLERGVRVGRTDAGHSDYRGVLGQGIFVDRLEGLGVLRPYRRNFGLGGVELLPAAGGRERSRPAGARVEAEVVVHLVVEERQRRRKSLVVRITVPVGRAELHAAGLRIDEERGRIGVAVVYGGTRAGSKRPQRVGLGGGWYVVALKRLVVAVLRNLEALHVGKLEHVGRRIELDQVFQHGRDVRLERPEGSVG